MVLPRQVGQRAERQSASDTRTVALIDDAAAVHPSGLYVEYVKRRPTTSCHYKCHRKCRSTELCNSSRNPDELDDAVILGHGITALLNPSPVIRLAHVHLADRVVVVHMRFLKIPADLAAGLQ